MRGLERLPKPMPERHRLRSEHSRVRPAHLSKRRFGQVLAGPLWRRVASRAIARPRGSRASAYSRANMVLNPDPDQLRPQLEEFVRYRHEHLRGDEKGEAQVFLDRLFRGFGHAGVFEAGATLEERVQRRDNGGTAFADLVWKPRVLIEMKRGGEDLRRHYRQAFEYWIDLVPDRPAYVVLCNFDEFAVSTGPSHCCFICVTRSRGRRT